MLSSATLVFIATDEAAAATDYSYILSKNSSGKTIVKSVSGYTAYSSSDSRKAIQWAIDHSVSGKTVLINAGIYTLTSGLNVKRGITLSGVGDTTILRNGEIDVYASNVGIKSLRMEGTCHVLIASKTAAISNIVIQDVSATTGVTPEVFSIKAASYKVSNIKFIRDIVTNSAANGFTINGKGPISDVLFDSCKAISNGLINRPTDWVVGFALDSSNSIIQNVMMIKCEASYNWESGFFLSPLITKTGVVLQDCVASYNGQKPDTQEGYGYLLDSSVSMINSTGVGNKGGLTNLEPAPQPVEKKESTMAITVPSSSVNMGSSMVASGVLSGTSSSGSALISGATVRLSVNLPDGTIVNPSEGSTAVTDASGRFTISYAPAIAGTVTYTATFDGDSHYNGISASVSFTAVAPTPQKTASTVILTLATGSVKIGSGLHVDGVLKSSSPIPDATVSLAVTLPDGSTANPVQGATAVTDASGMFSIDYVPATAGTYVFIATFGGSDQYLGSSTSASFNAIAPTPPPTTTYDYIVSSNVVKGPTGSTAYTGSSFSVALNWALTQTGKKVYVPSGTYTLSWSIDIASGVMLYGDGSEANGTVFKAPDAFSIRSVSNVHIQGIRITGGGSIDTVSARDVGTMGNITIQDVTVIGSSKAHIAAFTIYARNNSNIIGVQFIRCVADTCDGFGFGVFGEANEITDTSIVAMRAVNVWVKNVYLEDCKALNCGLDTTNHVNAWVCGYDLAENTNVDTITLVRCEASNNWLDGFHWEDTCYVYNVNCYDCVANNNGKAIGQQYAQNAGFCFWLHLVKGFASQVALHNCTGYGNYGGDVYDGVTPVYDLPPTD